MVTLRSGGHPVRQSRRERRPVVIFGCEDDPPAPCIQHKNHTLRGKGKRVVKPKFLKDPYTGKPVWIKTATLQEYKQAKKTGRPPCTPSSFLLTLSPQLRRLVYLETATYLADLETYSLPKYGTRAWQVQVTLFDDEWHSPYFCWTHDGRLVLATLPKILHNLPDPPKFVKELDLPEIDGLCVLAWEARRNDIPLPTIQYKWTSPVKRTFTSRTKVWEHAKSLKTNDALIRKNTATNSLKAGKLKFERDGLWVVTPMNVRPTSGVSLFLSKKRHEHQKQRTMECSSTLGTPTKFTLKQADSELRAIWKTLPEETKRTYTSPAIVSSDEESKASAVVTPEKPPAPRRFCLTPMQIDKCYEAGIEHYDSVMRTVTARDLSRELQDGFDVLRERGRGRFDMELPVFDTPPFAFLQKAPWMPIVQEILGKQVVLIHKGMFLSMPGAERQTYHQDGPHLNKVVQKPCHAVNVFIPLVDLTLENGPTEFCLGSHVLGHEDFNEDCVQTPTVKAGTPVIFDYRLGHRGLANHSKSCRPLLYCTYAKAADGREFRDSVNFSRKRYHRIGDIVERGLTREERAQKRMRVVEEKAKSM